MQEKQTHTKCDKYGNIELEVQASNRTDEGLLFARRDTALGYREIYCMGILEIVHAGPDRARFGYYRHSSVSIRVCVGLGNHGRSILAIECIFKWSG